MRVVVEQIGNNGTDLFIWISYFDTSWHETPITLDTSTVSTSAELKQSIIDGILGWAVAQSYSLSESDILWPY